MNSSKKSRKNLYGYITQNLEDNSQNTVNKIGSLKLFKNKKIDNQLKVIYGGNNCINDTYDIPNVCKSKSNFSQRPKENNGIKNAKISITYHKSKPKPKKKYYGSKTNKNKCVPKINYKNKCYGDVPDYNQYDIYISERHKN
ncbi:putative ORFan [Tupanvirus deep ocean]|uniref:ORFan n=2 Tax=Tupanvirus TaxID=2094720 RepID=A0AC62AAD3_9VIRU|nr:putative ORFan [Tupanvirus deep ocean]QKU34638.1 putative ORFan [Tupanvirus deep ocean]